MCGDRCVKKVEAGQEKCKMKPSGWAPSTRGFDRIPAETSLGLSGRGHSLVATFSFFCLAIRCGLHENPLKHVQRKGKSRLFLMSKVAVGIVQKAFQSVCIISSNTKSSSFVGNEQRCFHQSPWCRFAETFDRSVPSNRLFS